jgi:DNA repair protein RadC
LAVLFRPSDVCLQGVIKITRDLIRAGELLKLEVVDHVIIGMVRHLSLRELGYFYR